jgi:tetratricopeptide (TPR) repeat protein
MCIFGVLCVLGMPAFATQSVTPAPPSTLIKIENSLRTNDYKSALELSHAALATYPNDCRLWTLRGMAYAGAHRPKLADAAYRQALKLVPNYLPALEGAAQLEYESGGKNAEDLLQRILALRPTDPTANVMLGMTLYKRGACKEAVPHFEHAKSLVDERLLPLSEYGICLSKLGRGDDAVRAFRSAAALAPEDRGARYNLALALLDAKRYDEALQTLASDIQPDSTNENALTLAADIYEAQNDTPHAVALLRQAIVANPLQSGPYLDFATLSSNHRSYQVGIDMLNAGLTRMPKAAQLYLARGALYAQLGNYDKAMDDFGAANRLDPQLTFAGTAEGITESQRHDFAGSLAKFREQVRLHPDNAFNQYLLAETLAQQGPDQGSAEYNEELRAAKNAVRLDPKLTLARGILAGLYLQSGKTNLAIEQCEAALKADLNDQEALYRLILSLRKTNRRGEIPSLTRRLLALRNAQKEREVHTVRYKLVDSTMEAAGDRH